MSSSSDQMSRDEEKDCRLLTENYLSAYQQIKLGKASKTEETTDQNHRRITMALKYHIARHTLSETAALSLLNKDLDDYDKDRVTSYELEMQADSSSDSETSNISFKSNLKTSSDVLQHIRPLACQRDPLKTCKKSTAVDRDIENLLKHFEPKKEPPSSRVPERPSRPVALEEEITAKKQEKREQFNELFQKYSRKHPKHLEDDELPIKPAKREAEEPRRALVPFKSAREVNIQEKRKAKKTLGGKPSLNSPFVLPMRRDKDEDKPEPEEMEMDVEDERLKNIDPKMVELIRNEIMDSGSLVKWEDVAGLEEIKTIIKEVIVYPMLRPDIFTGLRRPPKGILLFGPPGTGKTLIGKCIASQSNSTFFSISASSLTSKWVGEGEKMVRALFAVARVHQPAVIFIDEIDSLLTQRSETEHESSRRIKTEFLVQLDGAATAEDDRILVIGATNRPHELDEAARRRFVKRLYVPLPEHEARKQIVENLLSSERHELTDEDVDKIAALTKHYSGADMAQLCKEASMEPIRSIPFEMLKNISKESVRGVTVEDFEAALGSVRPSVSQSDLAVYVQWDSTYGSGTADRRR